MLGDRILGNQRSLTYVYKQEVQQVLVTREVQVGQRQVVGEVQVD